jgi:hypothetical protein
VAVSNFEICQLLMQLNKLYIEKLKQIYMTLFKEELSVGIRGPRGRDRMIKTSAGNRFTKGRKS